jgi:hypothetical protein
MVEFAHSVNWSKVKSFFPKFIICEQVELCYTNKEFAYCEDISREYDIKQGEMHIHLEHIDNSEEKVESCGHEKA